MTRIPVSGPGAGDPGSHCVGCASPSESCACVVARCACGIEYTDEGWRSLRFVGLVDAQEPAFRWQGVGEPAEMRNCACGSSFLRIEVGGGP